MNFLDSEILKIPFKIVFKQGIIWTLKFYTPKQVKTQHFNHLSFAVLRIVLGLKLPLSYQLQICFAEVV